MLLKNKIRLLLNHHRSIIGGRVVWIKCVANGVEWIGIILSYCSTLDSLMIRGPLT